MSAKPDWAFRIVVTFGIVLLLLAHCTPLGVLPKPLNAEDRWRGER